MNAIQACELVVKEQSCKLLRARKDEPLQFDVKDSFTGKRRGWFYLDHFTASAVTQVYNAVSLDNQAKLARLPLPRLLTIVWKYVK